MTVPDRDRDRDVPDYGLLDDAANVELDGVLDAVRTAVQRGEIDRREALSALSDRLRELSGVHPEADDITVRSRVVTELDPCFLAAGWQRLEPFEF